MSVDEDDEAVYCFGRNSRGQLGMGHNRRISPSLPTRIPMQLFCILLRIGWKSYLVEQSE